MKTRAKRPIKHAVLVLLVVSFLTGCSGVSGIGVDVPVELNAFLGGRLNVVEIEAIAALLNEDSRIAEVEYTSQEQAYEEFSAEYPELSGSLPPGGLPAWFRITPSDGADIDALVARLDDIDGVIETRLFPAARR